MGVLAAWEHKTPGDEDDIVAAVAIINDMKTDLTEEESRAVVALLVSGTRLLAWHKFGGEGSRDI